MFQFGTVGQFVYRDIKMPTSKIVGIRFCIRKGDVQKCVETGGINCLSLYQCLSRKPFHPVELVPD